MPFSMCALSFRVIRTLVCEFCDLLHEEVLDCLNEIVTLISHEGVTRFAIIKATIFFRIKVLQNEI